MLLRAQIVICGVLVLVAGLLAPMPLYADTIAVIGTGDVAGALGPEFAGQGHTIVYGSRDPSRRLGNNARGVCRWRRYRCDGGAGHCGRGGYEWLG